MKELKKIGYLIVLILILFVTLPAHGAVIFSEGYETGDHSNWTNTNTYGSGSLAEVLATNPYSGTYAGHYYRTAAGDAENNGYAYKNFTAPTGNIVYAKGYFRFDTIPSSSYNLINQVLSLNTANLDQTKARFNVHNSNQLQYSYLRKDGNWGGGIWGTSLVTGSYYALKIKFDNSGANPVITWYVNGNQIDTYTDTSTGTAYTPTQVRVGAFIDTGISNPDPWYSGTADTRADAIVVSDSDPDGAGIGASNINEITTSDNQSSYTFPSTDYSNNVLYIAFTTSSCASASPCTDAPIVTDVSGAGLTFTEIGTAGGLPFSSANRRLQAWRALATSGATTGVVTITLDGDSDSMGAVILEFTGTKTSGTNGSDAVANFATNEDSATSLAVSMAAFADPNNRPVAFFSHRADEPTTNEAGYTELYDDNNGTTPIMGYMAEWNPTVAETTPSASWSTSCAVGGFALEIAAATPCAFNYLDTPVDVSPGSTGWQDVDVSAYVPDGATGVILQVVSTGSDVAYGVRKNGSTDTWMSANATAKGGCQTMLMAGLDANRIFEVNTADTAVKTYLIGYTGDGVTFFTNAVDKSLATTGSFQDVDISSDTGGDTAIGAIFTVTDTGGSGYEYSLRKNGSTDDFYRQIRADVSSVHLIGVDSSELAEMKIANTAIDLHLTGYITSGAVFFTNAVSKVTGTTGSYVDVDITADLQGSDDANGAIFEIVDVGANNRNFAVRKNGATYDYYAAIRHNAGLVAIDDNDIFEQKIENTDEDLYVLGYTLVCSGAPANASPTLTVNDPDGTSDTVTVGDNYNINYDLADSDDTVTVAFYYDSDSSGLDGTAISGACATAAEGTGATCSWDTTGMTPGSYYVYGVTNDGSNPDVSDYSPGQITIDAGGGCPAVALVGSWSGEAFFGTNGFTYTPGSGSNRVALVMLTAESNNTGLIDVGSVTLGGQTLTAVENANGVTAGLGTGYHNLVWLGYLDETRIGNMSGNTLTINWDIEPNYPFGEVKVQAATYENVDQSTPVADSASNSATLGTTIQAGSVSVGEGDELIYVAVDGQPANQTAPPGYTEHLELDGPANDLSNVSASRDVTTSSTENPTATWTVSSRLAIISVVLNAATCAGNSSPTLTVTEPNGTGDTVTVGDNYNIEYDLADSDDTVTVAFYYDTNNSGLDGTAISGACATAAEGTGVTCTWDTTGMTPGSYYVYGVTNDGANPDVTDYSPGQITISAASATAIYYSVGTNIAALYSANASAVNGTLTLVSAADNNIGVGDEVRVGSNRYYITGRNSSTEFTIQNSAANGGTPGDTSITFSSQSITIYRAFNSLAAAVANSDGSSHLATGNLVSGNYQLNWPCYADGADSSSTLWISPADWTTGTDNYIKIYTPVEADEVGTSQRHNGVYSTSAYRFEPAPSWNYESQLKVGVNCWIEGLQFSRPSTYSGNCVLLETGGSAVTFRFSHNILKAADQTNDTADWGGFEVFDAGSSIVKVWNNTVYDFNHATSSNNQYCLFNISQNVSGYFYNNTVINCDSGIGGYLGDIEVINNIAQDSNDGYSNPWESDNVNTDYNISDLSADFPGSHSQNSTTLTFADKSGDDFHLDSTDTAAIGGGLDLDQDANLAVTDDIDGDARDASTPDIGADEYSGSPSPTTTLGDGTDPGNSTVAPGSADHYLDQFTFVTDSGSDSVTALTVTTANTTAIASVEIWNEAMDQQYFPTVSSPSGNDWSFSGGTAIPVTTSGTSFRVVFTAVSHAALAAGTYAVTGTVTSFTSTNVQAGSDTDSATITVDKTPPANATWETIAPGDQQIELNWTNPGDGDFYQVVILRRAGAAVGDAPTDGTEYTVGNTIGSSTVRYVGSLETFTDTGLTNGTDYYYKIFAYDDYINYASGTGTGPHTPAVTGGATLDQAHYRWRNDNGLETDITSSDFKIQHGNTKILAGQTSRTLTAGVDYTAPSAAGTAFVRIVSTRLSAGGNTTGGGNQPPDIAMAWIDDTNPITSSIVFERAVSTGDTRVTYEIVEYIGSGGGANEIVVREAKEISTTNATATTSTVPGITDDNAIAVFITGQGTAANADATMDRGLFTSEWLAGSDQAQFTRGDGTDTGYISYAVIEFTGSNWRDVQREEHSYSTAATWEYEALDTTLLDMSKTFLHVQTRSITGNLDEQSGEVYLSSTAQIGFYLEGGASLNPTNVVWVIENTQSGAGAMSVARYNGTRSGGAEPYYENLTITTVASQDSASIWGESARSTGTGTAVPRGNLGLEVTASYTVELFASDNGQTQNYRYETVQWPGSTSVGATWAADEDTKLHSLVKQTTKRLRFLVDNNSGTAGSGAVSYELQVAEQDTDACAAGSYTAVDSSSHWDIVDSSYVTDGDASTNVSGGLTDSGGSSWMAGEQEDSADATDTITLAADEFTEIEFTLQATSSATDGGDYCFRLYDSTTNAAMDTYSVYAQVSLATGANLTQGHYRWRNDDGGEQASADWWDSNYLYRQKVTFGTNHSTLPVDFTVAVGLNTLQAPATNVALASGDDVRVIWQPDAGGNVELDRIGDTWNNAATTIEFRLQSEVGANLAEDADGSYYIYYGYAGAGTPPTDEMNVYWFADFFNRTASTTVGNGWSEWNVNVYDAEIYSNALHLSGTNTGPADAGAKKSFPLGTLANDFTLTFDWTIPTNTEGIWTNYIQIGDNMLENSRTGGVAMGLFSGESNGLGSNYGIDDNMDDILIDTSVNGTHSFKLAADFSAKTFDYYIDDFGTAHTTGIGFIGAATALNQIRMANDQYAAGQPDFVWDNVKIVLAVADSPEETLNTEESYSGSGASWAADEDTILVGLAKNTVKRVRFEVSNEGTVTSGNIAYELQVAEGYQCSSPGLTYTAVDSFSDWSVTGSAYFTSSADTSDIASGLTNDATTFVTGVLIDSGDSTGSIALDVDQFTEIEFAVKAETSAPDGQNYCFRLYDSTKDRPLDVYSEYAQVSLAWTTSVKLLRFEAKGDGSAVNVEWETAHEIGNRGFYLYRSENPGGPYTRLNNGLIAGAMFNTAGRTYRYVDKTAVRGQLYYYKLEDVDDGGKATVHGPVCVDWDADGLPDDWELAYGFDPTVDDAMLDADNDGLSNLEEYERGTDPTNPDTDGDGILDGDEVNDLNPEGGYATRSLTRGVEVIAEDQTGITLELNTQVFDSRVVVAAGQEFERLSISEYIHGYTQAVGQPELPLKGILVDIPADKQASLRVLETEQQIHEGYRVYPVPDKVGPEDSDSNGVGEVFVIDDSAYGVDDYYPQPAAELFASYVYRGQQKQQLVFYPLSFNAVTGEIRHFTRLRVRIDYIDGDLAKASGLNPTPWQPPAKVKTFDNLPPLGMMASIFGAPPSFVSPLLSALVSLQGLVAAAWAPPDEDVSNAAYKITVASDGIYKIDQSVLTNNGINPALINLSSLRLYHLGDEVAIDVYDDNLNSALDAADYIRFYAEPVAAAYAKYTPDNVYWMTLSGGVGLPRRMAAVDGTPVGGIPATTHSYTHHHELNQMYWAKAPGADGLDRWIFSALARGPGFTTSGGAPNPLSGAPVDIDITLSDVGSTLKGTVTMLLYGGTDTDHEVDVSINGGATTTLTWSGGTSYERSFDDVDLVDGVNTITITCQSPLDLIAFDWFDITYDREFTAVSDSLQFVHEDNYLYQVGGFSTDSLVVFDITDSAAVRPVANWQSSPAPAPYTLNLQPADSTGDQRTYLALSEANIKTPTRIVENNVSDLAGNANGADYILITHRDLGWDINGDPEEWLSAIVNQREAQGLRVVVVDVEDIFDEFSYGMTTPAAIKDFLAYAYANWAAPAPQYVLLVGDAIYDFHDRLNTHKVNYVPTYLTFTRYMGETATDEWYAAISGDDAVPDIYIGRLPAGTANAAKIMVDKILAYENSANGKDWEKNVLLVADNKDEQWETVFETINNEAAALLPEGMNYPFEGYLRVYQENGWNLNAELVAAINAGALMVNYAGHGSYNTWANERILDSGDMASLTNTGRLEFFVGMSCLTGYFINTAIWDSTPLVELLMGLDNKGSVAALMPTGMTTTEGQHILNTALFEEIFTKDRRELGSAIAHAKMTLLANGDAYYEEVSRTFLLFGDPAMQLKVPIPRRPQGLAAGQQGLVSVALSWSAAVDADGNAAAGYNLYRKTAADVGYTLINSQPVTANGFTDDNLAIGTRYYYVVRSVDADGLESVDSDSVSIVLSAPASSLSGIASGSGGGGGGGGCFISTTQMAFNPDIMRGLAILGFIAILWRLIFRLRDYGLRRKAQGIRLRTSSRRKRDYGPAGKEQEFSSLNGDPPASIIKRNMAQQACGIWKVKYQGMEQDLHEML